MQMDQNELRKFITQVFLKLEAAGYFNKKAEPEPVVIRRAYVLCERNQESAFLDFLRTVKEKSLFEAVAVVELPSNTLVDTLMGEGLCKTIAGMGADQDQDIPVSIYPTLYRNSMCEAGLGMDSSFASGWMRKDFENGRKSLVMMNGIEPFTGKEPPFYRDLIVSYIRNLVQMDVRFLKTAEDIGKIFDEIYGGAAGPAKVNSDVSEKLSSPAVSGTVGNVAGGRISLETSSNLLMARDLLNVPKGSTVVLSEKKIISPLAKDKIREMSLTVING